MIANLKSIGTAISGARQFLTLLVLGAVAAWLYVQFAEVRSQRNALFAWADATCAATGTPYAASELPGPDGKPVPIAAGKLCRLAVANHAAFVADTNRQSAELLAAAMKNRDDKTATDAAQARAHALAARTAIERMETEDAEVTNDRVARDWFAALNDVAGLRAKDR